MHGSAMSMKRNTLKDVETRDLCRQFEIPLPSYGVGHTVLEAQHLAEKIGYPVVLKLAAQGLLHRSDIGGIALHVQSEEDVNREFQRLRAVAINHGFPFDGVLVDRRMPSGIEMIVGAVRDQTFGPTVMVGIGGIFVEIFHDVAYRICPCSHSEALAMLQELKGASILNGARGQPVADKPALAQIIVQASELIMADERILEFDLNPVVVYPRNAVAVDAKIVCST